MKLKIAPCLWFDDQAEEAARFYTGIFPHSKINLLSHYTEAGFEFHQKPAGSVMTVEFELDGQPFTALNGGPLFTFSEAVSFQILCEDQAEIDRYWDALTADGGQESQCGWLKDKFGVSWQVVPVELYDMMGGSDRAKLTRVMNAMFPMKKLDLATLRRAASGETASV